MRSSGSFAAFLLATALSAAAAEPAWPPSDESAARIRELQGVMSSTEATPAQREAAREELSSMLKSPAGQARGEKSARPARAAIEPFGPIVKPVPNPPISVPGVAHVEVVIPPRITVSPQGGRPVVPSIGASVDPRTGHLLHETPTGYIDPRTGAFVPK